MTTAVVYDVLRVSGEPVPDGEYRGIWGGRLVSFDIGNETCTARTSPGLGTRFEFCRVTVGADHKTVKVVPDLSGELAEQARREQRKAADLLV